MYKKSKEVEFYIKCLFAFYKKRESLKLKKICFLLDESSEKLLKNTEFRELIRRGAITPQRGIGNPNQNYFVDYYKIREIAIDCDFIRDIIKATDGKISKVMG